LLNTVERERSASGIGSSRPPSPDRQDKGSISEKIPATSIGCSEITVKAHRGKVMQKMRAPSLADLVRMAAKLDAKTDAKH